MNNITLESVIERYDAAIAALKSAGKKLSSEQILEVLIARDAVQAEITDKTRSNPGHLIRKVNELDKRLKQHAESIDWSEPLSDLQSIFNPPKKDWWWLLDPITPKPWRDRYDWFWRFLSLASLTASLSLVVDISTRFVSGGTDTGGVFAVIIPSVLTLLAGGGALTKTGQEAIEYILISLKINKNVWDEAICLVSVVLLGLLILFHYSLPCIANYYKNIGDIAYCEGQLVSIGEAKTDNCKPQLNSAEKRYNRAIELDPNNTEAHYKLGKIYEELQDFANAVTQYKIAAKGGILKAYDDLARAYIQEKDYTKADKWIGKCLKQAKDNQKKECTTIVALIQTYIQDKQYAKADNWLWKAVEPQRIQSTNNRPYTITNEQYIILKTLARVYLDEGEYASAFRWLSLGQGGTKGDLQKQYTLLTYLGWTLLNQERYSEAKDHLQNAISLKGQSQQALAHCLLAQVLEKSKEQQGVNAKWEQCIAYGNQNNPDEYNRIALAHKYFQTKGQQR